MQLIALNKTCRFCPACALLIAHADQLATFFAAFFGTTRQAMTPEDYFVVGTIDRTDWARQPTTPAEMFAVLHDFTRIVSFNPMPTWVLKPK